MAIYFGNYFKKEAFVFESVGNRWKQEEVHREHGYPKYHYLQTERGCGIVEIDGKKVRLEKDSGILIAPEVPHSYESVEGEWTTAFATFSGTLEFYLKNMLGNERYRLIGPETGRQIAAVLQKAVEHHRKSPNLTSKISVDCYELLMLLSENAVTEQEIPQTALEKYVQPVQKQIEHRYMEELTVEELAGEIFVSVQYLSRLFKKFYHCSVYEYLTNYRMNKAKELLLTQKNRKIQDIAADVGYADASHFIMMFHKMTQMTPTEFRKLHS